MIWGRLCCRALAELAMHESADVLGADCQMILSSYLGQAEAPTQPSS